MLSDMEIMAVDERSRLRRTNKPMMEKKRRARINQSLAELKQMLIEGKQNSPSHAKWEKADILEMTVEYLKKLLHNGRVPPPTIPCSRILEYDTIDVEKNMDTASEITTLPYHSSPSNTNTTTSPAPSPSTSEVKRRKLAEIAPSSIPLGYAPPVAHPIPLYNPQLLNSFALQQQYMLLAKAQQMAQFSQLSPNPVPPPFNPYSMLKISTGIPQ